MTERKSGHDELRLRDVAEWRMQGYSVSDIAGKDKLDRSERLVKRMLAVIRRLWKDEVGDD